MVDLTMLETGGTDAHRAKTIRFSYMTVVVCVHIILEGHSSIE